MHKKKNYGKKRIDNWLIYLQDLIPQIVEIKYQRGIDNIGPNYLPRYETTQISNQQQVLAAITRSMAKQIESKASTPITVTTQQPNRSPRVSSSKPPIDFALEKIKIGKDNDINIQHIISCIKSKKRMNNFILYNNVLFYLTARGKHETKRKVQYIPSAMVKSVLEAFHDHPMSGHFVVQRTLHKVRSWYWWPSMRESVENHIASCQQCRKFNIVRSKTPGHLKSYNPLDDVFQVLHMDFWGPARTSYQENRYVIVLTDNLSKYVIANAVSDNTAKSTAEFIMKKFIMVHGAPERLITDNGVHFNNELMKTITTAANIAHVFSVSYHPQTNGQIERFDATFCAQLARYYTHSKDDWDDYLQSVVYAYNTDRHATTGFVPYELAFGRNQKSPFDPTSVDIHLKKPNDFCDQLKNTRRIMLKLARASISHQQQLTKQRCSKHRKDICYSVNDSVFLKVCGNRTKLDERWIGPYRVILRGGEHKYLVEDNETDKTVWAHASQLQPVVQREMRR
jgi:transposase InsO family protein